MTMTKWFLAKLLFAPAGEHKFVWEGHWHRLHSVQREDGSGSRFNIETTYTDDSGRTVRTTIFITTTD